MFRRLKYGTLDHTYSTFRMRGLGLWNLVVSSSRVFVWKRATFRRRVVGGAPCLGRAPVLTSKGGVMGSLIKKKTVGPPLVEDA